MNKMIFKVAEYFYYTSKGSRYLGDWGLREWLKMDEPIAKRDPLWLEEIYLHIVMK